MKLKKIIIILIVVLIILLGIVALLLVYNKNFSEKYQATPPTEIPEVEIDSKLKRVSIRNNFYVVKNCINKFYTNYAGIYELETDNYIIDEEAKASIEDEQKQNAEIIYNMLDPQYIEFKGITKDNILTKLQKMNTSIINITNMYVSEKTTNIAIYIAQGTLREKQTGKVTTFQIMLKVDSFNRTFTIFLQDYINATYKDLKLGNDLEIEFTKNIEKNTNNTYDFKNISDEEYAIELFNQYKEEIIYSPELVYNNLDAEYKNKRFESLEKFKEYARNNVRKNVIMQIKQYQKIAKEDSTQYVCIDQNGNNYIFKETDTMKYTLILDTYTLELPEFKEKYMAAEENEKVLYNIQKVFEAINSGDYKYVYNKLDNTFKANYFKTQADFENYIKQRLYTNNKASYGDYQKNGEVYVYNIQITDGDKVNKNIITKKIVMQLKEGTDFVMSFNVN